MHLWSLGTPVRRWSVPVDGAPVWENLPVAEMVEIAGSTASLRERAQALLQRLDPWVPSDAAWLALSDPGSNAYATVGSTGLDRSVIDFLDRPAVAQEIQLTGVNRNQPPVSVGELPVAVDELPTWAECLTPAGFREGFGRRTVRARWPAHGSPQRPVLQRRSAVRCDTRPARADLAVDRPRSVSHAFAGGYRASREGARRVPSSCETAPPSARRPRGPRGPVHELAGRGDRPGDPSQRSGVPIACGRPETTPKPLTMFA